MTDAKEIDPARKNLQRAAKLFGKSSEPDSDGRFSDLLLRRAAIDYVRELLSSMLEYSYLDLNMHELLSIAEGSLELGAKDPRLAHRLANFHELASFPTNMTRLLKMHHVDTSSGTLQDQLLWALRELKLLRSMATGDVAAVKLMITSLRRAEWEYAAKCEGLSLDQWLEQAADLAITRGPTK